MLNGVLLKVQSLTAIAYGCKQVDEFSDEVNEITKVFALSRADWIKQETGI